MTDAVTRVTLLTDHNEPIRLEPALQKIARPLLHGTTQSGDIKVKGLLREWHAHFWQT